MIASAPLVSDESNSKPLNGNGHDLGLDPLRAERRRRVNRRNAKKSTGPRTPAGKLRSSKNAITHGIFAADPIVAGDDPEDFRQHRITLMRGLNPRDVLEMECAEQYVLASWKLKRAELAEVEHFQRMHEEALKRDPTGTSSPGMLLEKMIAGDDRAAERFQVYQRRLQVMRDKALKQLEYLKHKWKEESRSEFCHQVLHDAGASCLACDAESENEASSAPDDVKDFPNESYGDAMDTPRGETKVGLIPKRLEAPGKEAPDDGSSS